jgi:hypothetical protein
MSDPLIKTKIPQITDNMPVGDVVNFIAKTLNESKMSSSASSSLVNSFLPVGSIIHSMLTVSQFQAISGNSWVLANGQSCSGSTYSSVTGASAVPDCTGRFLRGKGSNNPDGDLTLGTYSADKVHINAYSDNGPSTNFKTYMTLMGAYPQSVADNETAPKNITVNIFIKIN